MPGSPKRDDTHVSSPHTPTDAVATARPNLANGGLVKTPEYLTPEERTEREELKSSLRERIAYQQMARNLRAKLQYAAWKVRHNVSHLTFEELEASVRQETDVRLPNQRYQVPALVAAGSVVVDGDPADFHWRSGSKASPGTGASTSDPKGIPRKVVEGADAIQSLYASILAQPTPRPRARTRRIADAQPPAPMPPSSKHTSSSHAHQVRDHDGKHILSRDGRTTGRKQTEMMAGSKRTAPEGALRKKASRRKRADDAAIASRDEDQDSLAAARLTNLFRSSRRTASNVQVVSHLTYPSEAGSFDTASSISPSRPVTSIDRLAGTQVADQEAVRLLYYLHESSSPARSTDAMIKRDAPALERLSGKDLLSTYILQATGPVPSFSPHREPRPDCVVRDPELAASVLSSARPASMDTEILTSNVEHLPPHARKLLQKPIAIVDLPSPVHVEPERAPTIYITPPTPPTLDKSSSLRKNASLREEGPSNLPGRTADGSRLSASGSMHPAGIMLSSQTPSIYGL